MASYNVIGLMAGSSLDGIDMAYCTFTYENDKWTHEIVHTDCIPYPQRWKLRLNKLVMQNAITYIKTHTFYGHYLGDLINEFIDKYDLQNKVDFVASHGQTIFHQPENLLTSQIGDGAAMAAKTRLPVICNFRTCDVALNGQGAPIVPLGDKLLYAEHRFALNIGGIANISCELSDGTMLGYDVCAANLVLNTLARYLGKEYDEDGIFAESGVVDNFLLDELNRSWYAQKAYPKTLGGGYVTKVLRPMFARSRASIENKLRTYTEHIATQVAKDVNLICAKDDIIAANESMLVTGGGAFNKFLVQRITDKTEVNIVVPNDDVVKFKEALIMAFLGVLRWRKEPNCLSSVTGADRDTVGGAIYFAG